jgi:hypothetical protein
MKDESDICKAVEGINWIGARQVSLREHESLASWWLAPQPAWKGATNWQGRPNLIGPFEAQTYQSRRHCTYER